MLHQMKLEPVPFEQIRSGSKTIEIRLRDEKRQQVQVGDFIEFSCTDAPENRLQTRVTALHPFGSFAELFAALPKEKLGYAPDDSPDPAVMDQYYSAEKQAQFGVLGIELSCTALQRFMDAQAHGYSFGMPYDTALAEIRAGLKRTDWMWYIFPQIAGLGRSRISVYISISDLNEARDYYAHPVLGGRLIEISEALLPLPTDDPMAVFGYPDAYKLRSCMTLFRQIATEQPVFQQVLDKYCGGTADERTLQILEDMV